MTFFVVHSNERPTKESEQSSLDDTVFYLLCTVSRGFGTLLLSSLILRTTIQFMTTFGLVLQGVPSYYSEILNVNLTTYTVDFVRMCRCKMSRSTNTQHVLRCDLMDYESYSF